MALSNTTIASNANKTMVVNSTGTDIEWGGYVNRGDPAAFDYTTATLTADSTYRTLNLSSIVPANAKLVQLRLLIANAAAGQAIYIRKVGYNNEFNILSLFTQAPNVTTTTEGFVDCIGQQISYKAATGSWSKLNIVVLGWII